MRPEKASVLGGLAQRPRDTDNERTAFLWEEALHMPRARLVLVPLAVVALAAVPGHAAADPTDVSAVRVTSLNFEVGDCLNDLEAWEDAQDGVATAWLVPCTAPHEYEVFATFDVTDRSYPGAFTFAYRADELCADAFEEFVGVSYADSAYAMFYLYPTPQTWRMGDRQITCMIVDPDGPVTESLAGAERSEDM